jgi:hypothetical protein
VVEIPLAGETSIRREVVMPDSALGPSGSEHAATPTRVDDTTASVKFLMEFLSVKVHEELTRSPSSQNQG